MTNLQTASSPPSGSSKKATHARRNVTRFVQRLRRQNLPSYFGALMALIALSVVLSLISPTFLSVSNIFNIGQQSAILAVIAIGGTAVIILGGIDLSVGSVIALSGAVLGVVHINMGINIWIAVLAALIVGGIVGSVSGSLIVYGGLPPFIATLAMLSIASGLALVILKGRPLSGYPHAFRNLTTFYVFGWLPTSVIIAVILMVIAALYFKYAPSGRSLFAMGANLEVARLSGIPTRRLTMLVYIIAGILAAGGGAMMTSRLGSAQPTAGVGFELDVIAAVVIGGALLSGGYGSIAGTAVGVIMIGVLRNGLNLLNVSSFWQQVVIGAVIALAVLIEQVRQKRGARAGARERPRRLGQASTPQSPAGRAETQHRTTPNIESRHNMQQMRRILASAAALTATLALTACGSGEPVGGQTSATGDGTAAADGEITIGFSISTMNNPFFVSMKEGVDEAETEQGVSVLFADAGDAADKQANQILNFISQGVDVAVLNPTDGAAIVSSVEALNNAGIPVITVDRTAEGGDVAAHIGTDNVIAGEVTAKTLFDAMGGEGKVAILEGVAGASSAIDRGTGFQNVLADYPGIEIVATQTANYQRSEGLTVAQNILQAHPDLDAFLPMNDEMALGAVEAIRAANADVLVIGIDGGDDAIAAVKEGTLVATVAQQSKLMGSLGIEQAKLLAQGQEIEALQPVDVLVINADNVNDYS